MPTPSQLAAIRKHANRNATEDDKYFIVHEVVELVDEGEEGFGEEDLHTSAAQQAAAVRWREKEQQQHSSSSALSQSTIVTQSTFDAAVRENIDEFDMDEDEAIEEAYKQFEMQGAILSNINTGRQR